MPMQIMARVSRGPGSRAPLRRCAGAAIVFEGVPEVLDLKREALAAASHLAGPDVDHRLDHLDDSRR